MIDQKQNQPQTGSQQDRKPGQGPQQDSQRDQKNKNMDQQRGQKGSFEGGPQDRNPKQPDQSQNRDAS
jgi:hypothetical protein